VGASLATKLRGEKSKQPAPAKNRRARGAEAEAAWDSRRGAFAAMDEVSHELGHIQLIIGPMFSGKTTEMLRRIRRYTIAKRRCLVVKYEGDTRYSKDLASTHDRATHKAISCSELAQVRDAIADVDVIGIDEVS
jgi:hypothetical protein